MTNRRGFLASLLGLLGLSQVKAESPKPVSGSNSDCVMGPIHVLQDNGRVRRIIEGVFEIEKGVSLSHPTVIGWLRSFHALKPGWLRVSSRYEIDKAGRRIEYKITDEEMVS